MSKKNEKKIDKRVDYKYLAETQSCGIFFGGSCAGYRSYETYQEAEEAAQKSAYQTGEEALIYQAIATAEPKVKESVDITKLN